MNAAAQSRLDSIEPHDDAVPRADVHDGLVRNAIAHPVPRLIERRKDFARVETTFAELPEARRDERRGPSPEIVKCDERGDREVALEFREQILAASHSERHGFPKFPDPIPSSHSAYRISPAPGFRAFATAETAFVA